MKRLSDIAHAHGAYLYADIIQGVGCTPIDVETMGIDFCATSTYKWLMGEFGIGFLYVREDLQETVVKQTRFGLRNVAMDADFDFETFDDGRRYEGTSSIPILPGILAHEGLKIVERLGVESIMNHARPLVERLQESLPQLGYKAITPLDAPTPIVSFVPSDIEATRAKLEAAFDHPVISFRRWYRTDKNGEREAVDGIRVGVSVYNNHADLDRLLGVLS